MPAFLVVNALPAMAQSVCSVGCVTTYAYDDSRDNVNPHETVFKATSFPTLSTTPSANLLGEIYAQPLYISQMIMGGGTVNALFVATEENRVYALDGTTLATHWGPINLNPNGYAPVPDAELPGGCQDIRPEVGITGTPVIDRSGNVPNVMYVVSKDWDGASDYEQQLNALNISDGTTAASPVQVKEEFTDLGLTFNPQVQNQRAGLAVMHDSNGNPLIFVAWGAHCDTGTYTGKVAVFTLQSLGGTPTLYILAVFDVEPSTSTGATYSGGIWMSGAAPAVDDSTCTGNCDVYLASGNGFFQNSATLGNTYGDSLLRLTYAPSPVTLTAAGFYTPNEWQVLNNGSGAGCSGGVGGDPLAIPAPGSGSICGPTDFDLGSGGVTLLRPTSAVTLPAGDHFVLMGGGKEGVTYIVDPSNMSNTAEDTTDPCSAAETIQCFASVTLPATIGVRDVGLRGSAAFWSGNSSRTINQNALYVAGSEDPDIRAYQMPSSGGGTFTVSSFYGTAAAPLSDGTGFSYPGACPVVTWDSTNGAQNDAVLWILSTNTGQSNVGLFAYQALPSGGSLTQKFSDTTSGPFPTKFSVPTVVNGHVYVAGRCPASVSGCSTCTAGSCFGEVVSWH